MEASSHRHSRLLTSSIISLSPHRKMGAGLKVSSFSSWLCLFSQQSSSRSYPGVHQKSLHQKKKMSLLPRKFQGTQELQLRFSCKLFHSGNYKSFRNCVSRTRGGGQICSSYYVTVKHTGNVMLAPKILASCYDSVALPMVRAVLPTVLTQLRNRERAC